MKTLIAYFSRKGNNYVGGNIVNLPVGNTEIVVEKIQAPTGGELFEIKTVHDDSADYDVIYLGYPSWWNILSMPVVTFVEQLNWSDTGRLGKKWSNRLGNRPWLYDRRLSSLQNVV